MIYGAAFFFDVAAESAIRDIWQAEADAGISAFMAGLDYLPHMTLFCSEGLDVEGMRTALRKLAAETPPQDVTFHGLGLFPGEEPVIFLAPTPNRPLLDLHAACWDVMAPYAQGIPAYYYPGVWAPHVTLGVNLKDGKLAAMLKLLRERALSERPLPSAARITGVMFGGFDSGGHSRLNRVAFGETASAVTIRQATTGDAEAYNRLVDRLDHETQFMMAEPGERRLTVLDQYRRIQGVLKMDNQMIFVAENGSGELVGLLGAHGGAYRRNRGTVHIYIGILQAYSGQGLGTRMFEAMETWARGWGAHRLELTVMVHNRRGQGLYQKMGFRIEGRLRGGIRLNGAYIDEFIMSKLLE